MTIENDLPEKLYNIGSSYRQAKVLLSAVELDLFSVLAKGPLDAAALAFATALKSAGGRIEIVCP